MKLISVQRFCRSSSMRYSTRSIGPCTVMGAVLKGPLLLQWRTLRCAGRGGTERIPRGREDQEHASAICGASRTFLRWQSKITSTVLEYSTRADVTVTAATLMAIQRRVGPILLQNGPVLSAIMAFDCISLLLEALQATWQWHSLNCAMVGRALRRRTICLSHALAALRFC